MHLRTVAVLVAVWLVAACGPHQTMPSAPPPTAEQPSDPCKVEVPEGYRGVAPAVLDKGLVWGLTPAQELTDRVPVICFVPRSTGGHLLRSRASKRVELPAYVEDGSNKAYVYLAQLSPAGDWVVAQYCRHVPGWAQPSGCVLEGIETTSGKRLKVWEGLTTGGNQVQSASGAGAVVLALGSTCPTGVCVGEVRYTRLSDGTRKKLPIPTWPNTIAFKDGTFVIVGTDGHVYRVAADSGELKDT